MRNVQRIDLGGGYYLLAARDEGERSYADYILWHGIEPMREVSTFLKSDAISFADAMHALRQGSWQPIDTAPRNGTHVLLYCPTPHSGAYSVVQATWELREAEDAFGWGDPWDSYEHFMCPELYTHWQPLPAAPANDNGEPK